MTTECLLREIKVSDLNACMINKKEKADNQERRGLNWLTYFSIDRI
jgi:hypothetical protein